MIVLGQPPPSMAPHVIHWSRCLPYRSAGFSPARRTQEHVSFGAGISPLSSRAQQRLVPRAAQEERKEPGDAVVGDACIDNRQVLRHGNTRTLAHQLINTNSSTSTNQCSTAPGWHGTMTRHCAGVLGRHGKTVMRGAGASTGAAGDGCVARHGEP